MSCVREPVPPPSHPMLVSFNVLTERQATFEAVVNKTVFTRWGEGERDLWNLNGGESLIFYSSLLVKWKKKKKQPISDSQNSSKFFQGDDLIKWKINVTYIYIFFTVDVYYKPTDHCDFWVLVFLINIFCYRIQDIIHCKKLYLFCSVDIEIIKNKN